MAYDEKLAARIRTRLGGVVEKKMFGGLAFLLNGNMCCGVSRDEMIVRLDPPGTQAALEQPHVRLFEVGGRSMKGWILVGPEALANEAGLSKWVRTAVDYARSLPPK
jgi:TfoX/Sxy family transcriptional regulator of competence genes